NDLQNFPVLLSTSTGTNTMIGGTLNSVPYNLFRIEFFTSTNVDPSGYGEGEQFLGFTTVTTDANGNGNFTFIPSMLVATGQWITATATGPTNSTSEFSLARQIRLPNWVARYDGLATSHDQGAAVAFDSAGNVYVTGLSYGVTNGVTNSD